jgi:membrane protease YdiL (CAAX protease family)
VPISRIVWRALPPLLVVALALLYVVPYLALRYEIPGELLGALLPAFLLEAALYVLFCTEAFRSRVLSRRSGAQIAGLCLTTAPVSYLLYTVPLWLFSFESLAYLMVMAAVASFWHVFLPRSGVADLGYLLLMACPVLFKLFEPIYPDPAERVPMHILGLLMWYRIGIVAVLCIRRMEGIGFGLVPKAREWRIGLLHYMLFLPAGYVVAQQLQFIRPDFQFSPALIGRALLTFAGALLVLAAAEEFFFRGLLQQMLSRTARNRWLGLVLCSVIFGAAHLAFRDAFPNWRMALLATLAGLFYGHAYQRAGSVRAAMVTHALVVATWRVFLS